MKQIFKFRFFFVLFCCCYQTAAMCQTINFKRNNYEINFPNTWVIDTSQTIGTEFFICANSEIKKEKKTHIISLIVQNLAGKNIDIIKYKQITDLQMNRLGSSGKIFDSKIVESQKGRYFQIVCSIVTQDGRKQKSKQICFIKKDIAYLLTFTSDFDKFDQYKKEGEKILNSFTLNN